MPPMTTQPEPAIVFFKLSDDSGWSLRIGVRNIYFSNATSGATPNDFKGYAGLEYGF